IGRPGPRRPGGGGTGARAARASPIAARPVVSAAAADPGHRPRPGTARARPWHRRLLPAAGRARDRPAPLRRGAALRSAARLAAGDARFSDPAAARYAARAVLLPAPGQPSSTDRVR